MRNSTKCWSLEKTNKFDKLLARLTKESSCNAQTTHNRMHIHEKLIWGYHKQLYVNQLEKIDEMNEIQGKCHLTKHTQEEIESLNGPKSMK